jgi:hypothetical protein
VAIVVASLVAGIVGLLVLVTVSFAQFKIGGDAYRPTAAETQAAATTVPIRPAGCTAFVRVEQTAEIASDATAFGFNPEATPARAQLALHWFDGALVAAYGPAEGPMRGRLRNVDAQVALARERIAEWRGVIPKDAGGTALFNIRDDAYTQLRIAQRLLGRSCGGRLAPTAERVLFGPPFPMFSTTTRPPGTSRGSVSSQ